MIKHFLQLIRVIHINMVLAKHGLDNIVLSLHLFGPLRFLVYLNPWNWFRKHEFNRGKAIRESLEELGPIFVKFGQALSTRGDLLPLDIIQELEKLQDSVLAFPGSEAIQVIEKEFGKPIFEILLAFDEIPLASASIAQVHAAILPDGREIVLKILRPNIEKIIKRDVGILYTIAALTETYWRGGKRLKVREIVQEFETSLSEELDLMREAANASQLRRNFLNSKSLHVPEVYWEYTRQKVMAMERINGIPISDIQQLRAAKINLRKLAERGIEIFFTQVFRDCFFHADMHPGNLFVSYENPEDPQYISVDFGIMGTLTDEDKYYIAENMYAFFQRDYRRVAQLHLEAGWVPRDTRIVEFEGAIRSVCEPVFGRPIKDISFGQMLLRLLQTGRLFNMEIQPQLIMLQKTLITIEGVGRFLYPELDLMKTAQPILERWLKQQLGPKELFKNLRNNMPFFTEQLPLMPKLIYDVLKHTKEAQLQQQTMNQQVQLLQRKSSYNRFYLGFGSALIASSIGLMFITYNNEVLIAYNSIFSEINRYGLAGALIGLITLALAWWIKE